MKHKCTQSGQPRPYADTIRSYEITTEPNATDEQVWAYAQTFAPVNNRDQNAGHDGSCGFPFGLSPYGSLRQSNNTTWHYRITEPYCD